MAARRSQTPYLQPVSTSFVTRRIENKKSSDPLARQIARYTEGDCWLLALAIAEQNSYWKVAITDTEGHAFVVSEDLQWAIDIRGLCPLEQLLDEWSAEGIQVFDTLAVARDYFEQNDWGQFTPRVLRKQNSHFAATLLSEATLWLLSASA